MDYLKIVLDGYFNESSKEDLEDYFYGKSKKTQKKYRTSTKFFWGCYGIIEKFINHLKDKVQDKKREIGRAHV